MTTGKELALPSKSGPPARIESPSLDWEKLWLSIRSRPWRTLALVPAGKKVPRDFTLTVASQLERVGSMHLGRPLCIADATQVGITDLSPLTQEVGAIVRRNDCVLLALAPITENSTTVALAQAADLALLCVPLDQTANQDAKRTIAEIGAEKFVGSIALRMVGWK